MENENFKLQLTGKFEGSAATVNRLITTSRGSINPSFVTKKNEQAGARDTFQNGRMDSIKSKVALTPWQGRQWVSKGENPR